MPEIKVVSLSIPYEKRKSMAVWSKKTAYKIARKLKSFIGKEVYLYGGGSLTGEGYVVQLREISVKKVIYYKNGENPYTKSDDYYISVYLIGKGLPGGRGIFEPHIGSWRIGKIIK